MTNRRQLLFSTTADAATVSRQVAAGSLLRIARGIFSADLRTPVDQQVREHLWEIVARIATVYRNEYLAAMRQLSRERRTGLLARTLNRAWQWSAETDFSDQLTARHWLDRTGALVDSTDAERGGIRLRLPSELAIR